MIFRNLVEQVILPEEPPDHLLLFHGTSVGKAEKFASEGIKVPTGSIKDYLYKTALEILRGFGYTGSSLPPKVSERLDYYVQNTRFAYSKVDEETDRAIYTALRWNSANGYALQSAERGSEAYEYAMHAVWYAGSDTLEELGVTFSGQMPPYRYAGMRGMVVGALVPVGNTDVDRRVLEEEYARFRRIYRGGKPLLTSFQSFLADQIKDEVLVYRDIPASALFYGITSSDEARELVFRVIGY